MERKLIKYDLYNENFEAWFLDKLKAITPEQRAKLPRELLFKLFKNQEIHNGSISILEKMYILSIAFGQNMTISVEADEGGLDASEYRKAVDAQKAVITNKELLETPAVRASFILSNRDLSNSIMYVNQAQCTDIYRLIKMINPKDLNKKDHKFKATKEALRNVVSFLLEYEKNFQRIIMEFQLDTAQVLALLYFSTGEKLGKDFYDKDFKYTYNRRLLSNALTALTRSSCLTKRGGTTQIKYQLTAKGIDLLDRILSKIFNAYKNHS